MLKALQEATTFNSANIPDGTVINNSYRVVSKLGAADMGAVYNVAIAL